MKYYLHDSNSFNDEKVTELFTKFGFEGLGLFYTILEKLAQQEKPVKTEVLKRQLRVGKRLNKCWNFMESLGIISSNNGDTFNKQLLNHSEKYLINREKNAERIANWRAKKEDVTHYKSVRNTFVTPSNISKDKISKDNTIMQPSVAEENFSFKNRLEKMFSSTDRRMTIIAYYWTIKGWTFENLEKYNPALKRELIPSGDLKGYTNDEIKRTCQWLKDNADYKWTLETVAKYINEPLEDLKGNGKKLNEEDFITKLKKQYAK